MICVLDVTAGPARGRRFWLKTNQTLEIGRISSADISVPSDPHMSRRHLILEGTLSSFRVRDVGSANGTFVNNAKINTVELCSGDRIRAGESTFEVSVLDDDENPHAKDGFKFSSPSTAAGSVPDVPERSAAVYAPSDRDETDDQSTRRCFAPELPRDSRNFDLGVAQRGTLLSNNSWWSEYGFQASGIPNLLQEVSERSDKKSLLPDLIKRLEPDFTLMVIINVERLGRFGRQLLGTMVERGSVTWHTPSVCSIVDDGSREFMRTIEGALTQDALILFGGKTPPSTAWIEEIVADFSKPPTLTKLLREPSANVRYKLFSSVDFAVYEHDRHGRLSLLLRDLTEFSD